MSIARCFRVVAFSGIVFWTAAARSEGPILSELMAINQDTLIDEDGEFSDWIEIFNTLSAPVDLAGWALTDDPKALDKWQFPSVDIGGGEFLVVFASEKDRREPGRELHTSFKLTGDGEYLALVQPDHRTIASEYGPGYPAQVTYASFGVAMRSSATSLIAGGSSVSYLVPTDATLGLDWTQANFDDASWAAGPSGIGFDRKTTPIFNDLIQTNIETQLFNLGSSVYTRNRFALEDPSAVSSLTLRVKYDDGFVAFLNGREVARRNLFGAAVAWDSRASAARPDADALKFETISISGIKSLLRAGTNVLAIQGLNSAKNNNDFLLLAELDAVSVQGVDAAVHEFFDTPSGGAPNVGGFPGIAPEPKFSNAGGTFKEPLAVTLAVDPPGGEIRYTLDQAEPTTESALYTGPVTVDHTLVFKARVFQSGLLPGRVVRQDFVLLNADVIDFNSNLPLLVFNTFGRTPNANAYTRANMLVIDVSADGRARITDLPDFTGSSGLKVRGSSTGGQPKPNYALETWDERDEDVDVKLLGFPKDSDWILHAPFEYDPALIRNPFIYELSNEIGRYAVRTRFCEVFVNTRNEPLAKRHYFGVYSFMEKIKRGKNRVDIEKLVPSYGSEPLIGGGYMMKIDRCDPGDAGFNAGGQGICLVYPKQTVVTPPQLAWLKGYLDLFNRDLNASTFADPELGYPKYIDSDAWIDHHLLNVLTMNVDAFRLSAYFYKPRDGKLTFGPIWDFDRSMDSTDSRDDNPLAWRGTGDATDFFNYPWWARLFKDPSFMRKYSTRWLELRQAQFSTEHLNRLVDSLAAEITEAQVRNFQRWPHSFRGGGWQGEVNLMKSWLGRRAGWMDNQLIVSPDFSAKAGHVATPFDLALSVPTGEILYTVNGPDPRAANGSVAPEAVKFVGPIHIERNSRVRARTHIGAQGWSEIVEQIYHFQLVPLVITEVMYNPIADPGAAFSANEYEYVEVQNIGIETIDLNGVELGMRPKFAFTGSELTSLGPGEYAVIVRSKAAFLQRYGANGAKIAGELTSLGNLANTSQELFLTGPVGEPLLRFTYKDTWQPSTDGLGYSLVILDPLAPRDTWNQGESWRASLAINGSPGRKDDLTGVESLQRPGDINQDNRINISDAIGIVRHLVSGASALPCQTDEANLKLLDSDGNGSLNITDAVQVLSFLFQDGPPLALGSACVTISGCPASCAN